MRYEFISWIKYNRNSGIKADVHYYYVLLLLFKKLERCYLQINSRAAFNWCTYWHTWSNSSHEIHANTVSYISEFYWLKQLNIESMPRLNHHPISLRINYTSRYFILSLNSFILISQHLYFLCSDWYPDPLPVLYHYCSLLLDYAGRWEGLILGHWLMFLVDQVFRPFINFGLHHVELFDI